MKDKWFTTMAMVGLVSVACFTGCGNPADGVEEATVTAGSKDASVAAVAGAKVYTISADSKISFTGSKITGSHSGGFNTFSGSIAVADGAIVAPSKVEIDMDSTWSDSDRLTGHLKNADFFDVPTYPTSTFEFTGIEAGADGLQTVTGSLTLHGVTKSISFPAQVSVTDSEVTLKAEFFIKRFDFDIVFKGRADDLIRDEVVINLDIKAGA